MARRYIDRDALIAKIEKAIDSPAPLHDQQCDWEDGYWCGLFKVECIIDTLEAKEVNIAEMADDYYDALIKEAEMDVDMAGHCRLAYYNGCKDVLNKIQKRE